MANRSCSCYVVVSINFISLLCSLAIMALAIFLYLGVGSKCESFLQRPILTIGAAIFFVSLLGFLGASCQWAPVLWMHLFLMAILILLLASFSIFAFVVTATGGGSKVPDYKFEEYDLHDYSYWLQGELNNTGKWDDIRSCMLTVDYCDHLDTDYPTVEAYMNATLTPLESGCCRPPVQCGYKQVTSTYFDLPSSAAPAPIAAKIAVAPQDTQAQLTTTVINEHFPDCLRFRNDNATMCYNCDSCKGAVAEYVRASWRASAFGNIVLVIILSILYCVGCCARHNASQPQFQGLEMEPQFATGYQRGYQQPQPNPVYKTPAPRMAQQSPY